MPETDADWARYLEVTGDARCAALATADRWISEWGLVMPPCDPLVLHFGLDDFARTGEIEYWIVNDTDNQYCGKFLFLLRDQWCPEHCHTMKHETFYVACGSIRMVMDGSETVLPQGSVLAMPQGVRHAFTAASEAALVLEVSLPSVQGDNVFVDKRIGREGVL